MAEIQWQLLQQPDYFQDALSGQQAGRQQLAINALKGYQTDPSGTISKLIGAGDVTSASALANLQYQQQQRDLLAKGAQAFFGGAPSAPVATAASTPAAPDPSAQPSPAPGTSPAAPPVDPAVAAQKLERLDTTAQLLASVPYGPERKAALQQALPQLTALGFAPDQIASFDPTDQAIESVRQQVAQAQGQLGASSGAPAPAVDGGAASATDAPAAQAQPAPATAAPVAPPATGGMNIYDPNTQKALGLITLGAPQIGGALTTLGAAVAPKFGGGERPGSAIIDQRTGKIISFAPNADGTQIVSDGNGGWTTTRIPGFTEAEAGYQGTVAGAKAKAEEAAKAPYDYHEVSLGPGKGTVRLSTADYQTIKRAGLLPELGQTQDVGSVEAQKVDGQNFAAEVNTHGAPAIMGLQNARTITEQAIHLAQTLNPNSGTEIMGHLAGAVNAIPGIGHVAAEKANQVSTYQALLPQVMRGTFTTFPRLDKEFHIISQASASVTTPKDAATIVLATQAATQARNLAYANFVANYQGPSSKQSLTKAWLQTPQAQQSLFADPIWRGLAINGKPAVQVGTQPYKDGHVYGVFMPGTPQAQTFRVQ